MEIKHPVEIVSLFPIRKSGKQKKAFREAVQRYARKLGYPVVFEKGSFGLVNIVIGNPETAQYLITAHYDTCARMPIPNLITPRNLLLFFLYQLVLALMIVIPALLGGITAGWVFHSVMTGCFVWMALIWMFLIVIMIGPENPSNVNDNTSGVVAALEIAASLPENLRCKVCVVLFDLEEAGLIGSSAFRKKHRKSSDSQIVLNIDCVGEGDEICLFPTEKVKKDERKLTLLRGISGQFGEKKITVFEKGFSFYPSDQVLFPYGVGICALKRSKLGMYISKIHTPQDTVLDETNVNILRAALISLIGSKQLNKKGKRL